MPAISTKSLAALNALRCQVFGTTYNPNNVRTGAKFLKKSLVGDPMLKYYPPQFKLSSFFGQEQAFAKLIHPAETQRWRDVERKRAIGKGPPKKGAYDNIKCTTNQIRRWPSCYNEGQEKIVSILQHALICLTLYTTTCIFSLALFYF